jgi:hypothetical protein
MPSQLAATPSSRPPPNPIYRPRRATSPVSSPESSSPSQWSQKITAHVRLSGGATRSLELERPLPIAQLRKFKPELVATVDRLLDRHCDREIADILNRDGWRTWEAKPFNLKKVAFIRSAYKLPSRYDRLRRSGMLTTREITAKFGIGKTTVYEWGRQGLIRQCFADSLNRGLWEIPSNVTILKGHGGRRSRKPHATPITAQSPERGAV